MHRLTGLGLIFRAVALPGVSFSFVLGPSPVAGVKVKDFPIFSLVRRPLFTMRRHIESNLLLKNRDQGIIEGLRLETGHIMCCFISGHQKIRSCSSL